MRTVLIISYWFAPSPAVGAKRFSFLARELASQGYDVHVITNRPAADANSDATLPQAGQLHHCRESLKLPLAGGSLWRRAANALLRRLLAPIGWEILWARVATREALAVASGLSPGVVIATSPPHAALMAGADIARRLGWPLIIDYRDPWSAHAWPRWRRGRVAQWAARRIEQRVVRRSAARVLNTPAMQVSFEKFFPRVERERNFVIPNGFEPVAATAPPPTAGAIDVLHAGEIFTGRSLLPVLRAAASLSARRPGRRVRVITYGGLPPGELARIHAEKLEGFIEVRPRVPFADLFAELQRAHLLLAVVGEHMAYSTPYKVYDYMATGRPILGIAPRGAALFELLASSGAGLCVERDDAAAIERAIELVAQGDLAPLRARVENFRWANLGQQYRAVIEAVAAAVPGTSPLTGPAGRMVAAHWQPTTRPSPPPPSE